MNETDAHSSNNTIHIKQTKQKKSLAYCNFCPFVWLCYYTVHVYIVIYFLDSLFFWWKRICAGFFLPFAYISIAVGDPVIKRKCWKPSNQINPLNICGCPKPEPEFPTYCVLVIFFFMLNELRLRGWYW